VSKLLEKRFAKIHKGKIVVAPQPKNEHEGVQKLIWRYFVVRGSIDKITLKTLK